MRNRQEYDIQVWSDQEVAAGCQKGEPLSQKELYRRYFGQLLGIPMRYCGTPEEAKEVLNSGFLQIFTSLTNHYEEKGSLKGWMSTLVFRATMDYVRSRTTYRRMHQFVQEPEVPIDNPALDNLAVEEIFKLIQKLPAPSRGVFNLYVIDGYKHAEIAALLGIDEGTSRWHLSNARQLLKGMLHKSQRNELLSHIL